MHNIDKNYIKSKQVVKLVFLLLLILILGILFFITWTYTYNPKLRNPFIMKGNYFMALVYMLLSYIFMVFCDANNIQENKLSNIIFSEMLAILCTNVVVYFVMILPAFASGLVRFLPIVILSIYDFVVILVWSIIVKFIYKKYFPPKPMILISSNKNIDEAIVKFAKRQDIYNIDKTLVYDEYNSLPENEKMPKIFSCLNDYENVVIGDIPSHYRNQIIKYCFDYEKNFYIIPKLSDILVKGSQEVFTFDTPMFYSTSFGLNIENTILKRTFDILFSLLILIITSPILLIVSILIKIEDGGKVFFKQDRIGLNNKPFNIIKFRSMIENADSVEVLPTIKEDPRITKVGKFIRKYHIDELPQFINVLMGDMSVVGPRPERIEHVELYQSQIEEFKFRHKVKAGITGLAQIYGKYNTTAIDKLKLDLIYIENWSFSFDLELILRTFKVFITKDNTEGFDKTEQSNINENYQNLENK